MSYQKMPPYFVKDYFDYYKQPRGYHARSLNSNNGWAVQGNTSFANTRFLYYTNEIRNAVLVDPWRQSAFLLHGKRCFWKNSLVTIKKMMTVEGLVTQTFTTSWM